MPFEIDELRNWVHCILYYKEISIQWGLKEIKGGKYWTIRGFCFEM